MDSLSISTPLTKLSDGALRVVVARKAVHHKLAPAVALLWRVHVKLRHAGLGFLHDYVEFKVFEGAARALSEIPVALTPLEHTRL